MCLLELSCHKSWQRERERHEDQDKERRRKMSSSLCRSRVIPEKTMRSLSWFGLRSFCRLHESLSSSQEWEDMLPVKAIDQKDSLSIELAHKEWGHNKKKQGLTLIRSSLAILQVFWLLLVLLSFCPELLEKISVRVTSIDIRFSEFFYPFNVYVYNIHYTGQSSGRRTSSRRRSQEVWSSSRGSSRWNYCLCCCTRSLHEDWSCPTGS